MGLDLEDLVPEAAALVLTVQPEESFPDLSIPLFSLLRNGESILCFSGNLEGMTFIITTITIINTTIIHLDFPMSPINDQPIAGMWIITSSWPLIHSMLILCHTCVFRPVISHVSLGICVSLYEPSC